MQSMSLRSPLFAVLTVAAVAACTQQSPMAKPAEQTKAPTQATPPAAAAAATINPAQVSSFLRSAYGDAAKADGEWTAQPADKRLAEQSADGEPAPAQAAGRKVCAQQVVQLDGQPHLLLAVCGSPADFGHPTSGINDFFLLQPRGDSLVATAQAHTQEFGSMGTPGQVSIKQLGAQLYGFLVTGGFTNMGMTTSSTTVLLPKGDTFVQAATFNDHQDNAMAEQCEDLSGCKSPSYFNIEYPLSIDSANPGAAAYPLQISAVGTACGKPAQGQYTLTLDPATMTYAVPAALTTEGCE